MKDLKEKLSKLSVLVFGDMYLDRDCIGDFEGKSKEDEHISILKAHAEKYQPGGGGNLASCFASLGIKTTVVGLWGDKSDINRQILEQKFKEKGIDTSFMVESGKTLVFGKFYTSDGEHMFRYDIISENMNDEKENLLIKNIEKTISNVNFIACADYNNSGIRDMVCKDTLRPIIESKIPIFATGRKDVDKFKGFDYLFLNEQEFIGQSFADYAIDFAELFKISSLIITSEKGADVFKSDGLEYKSKSKNIEGDIDTCGCGDMFYAMYASSIMAGYDIETSLKLANLAAGIVAKKMFGAAQASIDEVISSL